MFHHRRLRSLTWAPGNLLLGRMGNDYQMGYNRTHKLRKETGFASMEYLGFVAGAITTFSFLPQVIRVFQLKSAYEISMLFTTLLLLGLILWLVYGILFELRPVIVSNAVAAAFVAPLLYAKLKYRQR